MRILDEHADHKPSLIFCNTRKSAMQAAQHLAKEAATAARNPFVFSADHRRELNEIAQHMKDRALADVCRQGTAFHHGGMASEDRRAVEDAFNAGHIAVLCACTCRVGRSSASADSVWAWCGVSTRTAYAGSTSTLAVGVCHGDHAPFVRLFGVVATSS